MTAVSNASTVGSNDPIADTDAGNLSWTTILHDYDVVSNCVLSTLHEKSIAVEIRSFHYSTQSTEITIGSTHLFIFMQPVYSMQKNKLGDQVTAASMYAVYVARIDGYLGLFFVQWICIAESKIRVRVRGTTDVR